MKFHAIICGMAGKRSARYQRILRNVKEYVTVCDQAGFSHREHHLQIEDMEAPGC